MRSTCRLHTPPGGLRDATTPRAPEELSDDDSGIPLHSSWTVLLSSVMSCTGYVS